MSNLNGDYRSAPTVIYFNPNALHSLEFGLHRHLACVVYLVFLPRVSVYLRATPRVIGVPPRRRRRGRRGMDYAHHLIGAVFGTFLLFRQGTVCQSSCPAPNLYTYAQTNEFR